ncbi:MAG: lysophospholipase [Anaerolineales bacterium]|nr:lysophospholipase [Anaerolineales bacterium]
MTTKKWHYKTHDGLDLYAQSWIPENPKALVCMIHGHGEHIERYAHVAAALNAAGYAFAGFDHRGHGQSAGKRGHTPSYDTMLDDIAFFIDKRQAEYPDLPIFLYGHSMGGNLVLNYVLRRKPDIKGVIATGPWIKLAFEPPAIQVVLGRAMDKIFPAFLQASGLETAAISRDADVVHAYENDPLVHDKISARLFVSMYEAGLWSLAHADELEPVMVEGSAGANERTNVNRFKNLGNLRCKQFLLPSRSSANKIRTL